MLFFPHTIRPLALCSLLPPPDGLSRGSSMGKPVGGDCDLFLTNRRPGEEASDLDLANRDAAGSPVGNSRHVPGPCASSERERQIGTFNREKNRPTVALPPSLWY